MTTEERFWAKVDKTGGDSACWTWTASLFRNGYGQFRFNGTSGYAHRFAVQASGVHIPPGCFVCHSCDNPKCVNPSHLFVGSHLDNMADMRAKGRSARGTASGHAKLSDADVVDIRRRRAKGESLAALSMLFGVCESQISEISRGLQWKHVEGAD